MRYKHIATVIVCCIATSCGAASVVEPEAPVEPPKTEAVSAVAGPVAPAAGGPLESRDESPPASGKPVKIYIVAGQSNAELRGNIEWTQKEWPEYVKVRPKLWHYRPGQKPPSPVLGETYDKFGVEFFQFLRRFAPGC